ncbi:MAG: hypothetical protein RL185_418 [Bacteroidota bacterium]|jgi:hypothetical protein
MKKVIVAIVTSLALVSAFAEAETKKVCKEKTDKAGKVILDKAGKPQEECKTIKVHKKLEGTKVEDVKKK